MSVLPKFTILTTKLLAFTFQKKWPSETYAIFPKSFFIFRTTIKIDYGWWPSDSFIKKYPFTNIHLTLDTTLKTPQWPNERHNFHYCLCFEKMFFLNFAKMFLIFNCLFVFTHIARAERAIIISVTSKSQSFSGLSVFKKMEMNNRKHTLALFLKGTEETELFIGLYLDNLHIRNNICPSLVYW